MFLNTRHIHLIAIGGIGMSGIAEILLNMGFHVSGSDLHATPSTDRLRDLGAVIHIGHREDQIDGADVVVYSSAVTAANPEIVGARRAGIPVIRRAQMLAELMRVKYGIAVAGSHGKTTTTSLVAEVLEAGTLDPTVLVGGRALATGRNAVLGGGDFLVAEADESDGTFLHLSPAIAVVTNIDFEHVDFYRDMDQLRDAFREFLERVPFYGACILCVDDPEIRAMIPTIERRIVTYGLGEDADIRAVPREGSTTRSLIRTADGDLGELEMTLPGLHNLRAAVAVGLELGLDFETVSRALGGFAGVGRRYESRGVHGGVRVVDDYGHHPTELAATLQVARAEGRRLVALFQPHRYSRTRRFRDEFADVLSAADRVALLPVYAASEEPIPGAGSETIAEAMREKGLDIVEVLEDTDALSRWIETELRDGDLLLTLGAGDIGRLVGEICERLDRKDR